MILNIKRLIAITVVSAMLVPPAQAHAAYTYEDAAGEFYEALELIDSVYYFKNELNYKKLLDEALVTVFGQLDEYSEYYTTEEFSDFQQYQEQSRSGIGVSMIKTGEGYAEVTKVYKNSPAEKAGILKGDIITMVGSTSVTGINLLDLRELIIGITGTEVKLNILRNGESKQITAKRGTFDVPHVERTNISEFIKGADNSKTAYVEITSFAHNESNPQNDTAKQFLKIYQALKSEGVKNLIIDLRGNSGGDVSALVEIANVLVRTGIMFTFKYPEQEDDVFRTESAAPELNIAVLVDKSTASSAEILASAIKESQSGVIVGTTTYGKGVGQVPIPFSDDKHVIKLTVTEIISRNGNKINGVGVSPDIYVEPAPWVNESKAVGASSSAEEIEQLKKALVYIGYDAGTGSSYDKKLTEAVKAFQTNAHMEPDGVITSAVLTRINDYISDKARKTDEALKKAYEALNK